MNIEEVREYCLNKSDVEETLPFGPETLVFKVSGKMFALLPLDALPSVSLKCDPLKALELREHYSEIIPGYHMNKKHWNTIDLEGTLSRQLVEEMIDHSYELVKKSAKRKS